ncbi:GDSL-type esterase/lipase family protein [Streptomyces asiaticus]
MGRLLVGPDRHHSDRPPGARVDDRRRVLVAQALRPGEQIVAPVAGLDVGVGQQGGGRGRDVPRVDPAHSAVTGGGADLAVPPDALAHRVRAQEADDIIAAHLQLAARARAHGAKAYAATIAPYGGTDVYSPEGDKAREHVNSWIRTSGAFDGVLDFDAVWRDPADPTRIRGDLHMGDYLHGNDAGYAALADSIDLSLFD